MTSSMFAAPSASGEEISVAGRLAEVLVGDVVGFGEERRIAAADPVPERIEPGGEVAVHADRLRQVDRADHFLRAGRRRGTGSSSVGGVQRSNSARGSRRRPTAGSRRYFSYSSST